MKKIPDMTQAASVLLVDLKRRFQKFTDPHDPDHCPVYLAATCLDLRYKVLLNPTQLNSAKKEILKQVTCCVPTCKFQSGQTGQTGITTTVELVSLFTLRFVGLRPHCEP